MGSHDHLGVTPQRRVGQERLRFEYIEHRRAQLAVECSDQRRGVHCGSAANVDQHPITECGQFRRADDASGGIAERNEIDHHVAVSEEVLERTIVGRTRPSHRGKSMPGARRQDGE